MDTDDMWFQKDSATCHTEQTTMDILLERFESMVICRCKRIEGLKHARFIENDYLGLVNKPTASFITTTLMSRMTTFSPADLLKLDMIFRSRCIQEFWYRNIHIYNRCISNFNRQQTFL